MSDHRALRDRAEEQRAAQRFDEAADLYLKAARAVPNPDSGRAVECRVRAAECRLMRHEYGRALDLLAQAPGCLDYDDLVLERVAWWHAVAEAHLGLAHWKDAEAAIAKVEQVVYHEVTWDLIDQGRCCAIRARIAASRGRYAESRQSYLTAIESMERGRRRHPSEAETCATRIALYRLGLGTVVLDAGDPETAAVYFDQAREGFQARGENRGAVRAVFGRARCEARRGRYADARRMLGAIAPLVAGDDDLAADVELLIGAQYLYEQLPDAAEPHFVAAASRYRAARQQAGCLLNLGHVHRLRGDGGLAVELYERAQQAFLDAGAPEWRARAGLALAALRAESGVEDLQAALDEAVPAILYLDARRFSLPTAAARAAYARLLVEALDLAFGLACRQGDARLVADLIETALNSGVHRVGDDAAWETDLAADGNPDAGERFWAGSEEGRARSGTPAASRWLDERLVLPMTPPPRLSMADGNRIALMPYLDLAERTYGTIPRAAGVVSVV